MKYLLLIGLLINLIGCEDSLNKIDIYPIIKNESESARLAGFGIINHKKNIYVHRDEYGRAEELIKSIL